MIEFILLFYVYDTPILQLKALSEMVGVHYWYRGVHDCRWMLLWILVVLAVVHGVV